MKIKENLLSKTFVEIFSLLLLLFFLYIPFTNKAISGDSIFYIYTAQQITKEPLKPFDFYINCADKNYRAWDIANNPPLISYLLAGIIKIFGENERIFHIIFFIFPALSVVGIYFLSREFEASSFFSALLLIASPAFFVNSTDIMLDIPMIAFSIWGIYLVIKNKLLGWFLLGFAILIKFVAILNLFLILFWFLLEKRKTTWKFLIPILPLLLWNIHNFFIYNEIQIFKQSRAVGISFGLVKEIPLMTYIGGSFIFPLSIPWIAFEINKKNLWVFIGVFSLINLFFNLLNYSVLQSFLFGVFISSFLFLIFIFINHIRTKLSKESVFLASWFFLFLVFFISVSAIIAVRYLLTLLPPIIILIVFISGKFPNQKKFLLTTSVLGIILSVFIAHSDYILANSYREIANYIKSKYSGKVFFRGDMSFRGFQYYMEKNGFACIDTSKNINLNGGYIIKSFFSIRKKFEPVIENNMKFLEDLCILTKNPLRTMSPIANAGFHLNLYGLLPYSLSNVPLEKFSIYKLRGEVK